MINHKRNQKLKKLSIVSIWLFSMWFRYFSFPVTLKKKNRKKPYLMSVPKIAQRMKCIRHFPREDCARNTCQKKSQQSSGFNLGEILPLPVLPPSPQGKKTRLEPAIQPKTFDERFTEPVIWCCDAGQRIHCLDSWQLIITRMSSMVLLSCICFALRKHGRTNVLTDSHVTIKNFEIDELRHFS